MCIRDSLASEPMVVMRGMHRRASTVTFPDGSVFHWQRRTWLAYRWRDAAGHTLIDYALHEGERPSASLTLHTGDLPPRTRDALIVLGWMAVLTYVFA
ncbi:MAG: hypothetical protein GYB64_08055, partial [Chloroflexi bacterium]|nr:hypothetical protein [Chloroflexota bacterium]